MCRTRKSTFEDDLVKLADGKNPMEDENINEFFKLDLYIDPVNKIDKIKAKMMLEI